jgi:hypothetical protein
MTPERARSRDADEDLAGWEWAALAAAGTAATLGWGLAIAAAIAAALAAAGAAERFIAARRGPRLAPRRVRLARRAARLNGEC